MPSRIDPRAPRFNQAIVGAGAAAAFLLDAPFVLPVLALLLGAGALLGPALNPLSILWRRGVVRILHLGPPERLKDAAPVRFAQLVGFVFLAAASVLLLVALPAWAPIVGWGLALIVAALALLAAIADVCVGCEIYLLARRLAKRPAEA